MEWIGKGIAIAGIWIAVAVICRSKTDDFVKFMTSMAAAGSTVAIAFAGVSM